jgi:hypothetical protein
MEKMDHAYYMKQAVKEAEKAGERESLQFRV